VKPITDSNLCLRAPTQRPADRRMSAWISIKVRIARCGHYALRDQWVTAGCDLRGRPQGYAGLQPGGWAAAFGLALCPAVLCWSRATGRGLLVRAYRSAAMSSWWLLVRVLRYRVLRWSSMVWGDSSRRRAICLME
jgi:hypothetical protein